jgi:capsular exopolysaccharide synthesis family protein
MFMVPGEKLRTLVVTSPGPQEGKTTISINMGITIAASGGRVVIIDTDMRRPKLHKTFGVGAEVGVSNYLVTDEPVTNFVKATEVPGLDLIPCGPCPPNPAELLHTARFTELIEELKLHYETIIFDSPPIIAVTDALVIGTQVDGVVLVAKSGKTTKETLLHARTSLSAVNARILGCVLNDLDLETGRYGYYHYVNRYGAYYGETEEAESAA